MTRDVDAIATVLHEAAELHHAVWRDTDGEDPDWASWYADWLLGHSELPSMLGATPVRSHLVHALVEGHRFSGEEIEQFRKLLGELQERQGKSRSRGSKGR